jgi:hypothetical protein
MARTTLDIDTPLLEELKKIQKKEKKSLGALVSHLLAEALAQRSRRRTPRTEFRWLSHPMGARIDISDKDALYAALDNRTDNRH